jgi:hypothetical protein
MTGGGPWILHQWLATDANSSGNPRASSLAREEASEICLCDRSIYGC